MSELTHITPATWKRLVDAAPRDWWPFVPCATCNAYRQQPCQTADGLSRNPHAARVRSGLLLHGTIWLLGRHPEDVLGADDGAGLWEDAP